jgi:acyl-CoA synthetase (AMP-forming)/AMP-acid ligase II
MTSNPLPPLNRKPGSVGPGQGVEVAILDTSGEKLAQGKEGEICVRGENVTGGYLNNEKANRESFTREGWFRTGDQGKLDEDGYVIITGRIKELINRGYRPLISPSPSTQFPFVHLFSLCLYSPVLFPYQSLHAHTPPQSHIPLLKKTICKIRH